MVLFSKYPLLMMTLRIFQKIDDKKYYGYSDHTIGSNLSVSYFKRAKIIEKHFTLDKSDNTIRDHALSATPENLEI